MTLAQLHAERRELLRRRRLSQAWDAKSEARLRSVLARIDAIELPGEVALSKIREVEVDELERRALGLMKS